MANRLVITMKNVGHIIFLVWAKQLLEPMRSLVACHQGNFELKKIEDIIQISKETREKADKLFQSVYAEAASLADKFGIERNYQNHVDGR